MTVRLLINVGVAWQTLPDNLSIQDIEGGEQRGSAVTLVIVSHRFFELCHHVMLPTLLGGISAAIQGKLASHLINC